MSINYMAAFYLSGNAKAAKSVDKLFDKRYHGDVPTLKILAINYDALITKDGWKCVQRFIHTCSSIYAVLDESTRIKNPKSKRSQRCMALRPNLAYRRIATGTPASNSPLDVFGQMEFLEDGLLGTTSYRSFVAEYAEIMPDDGHLMRHIQQRQQAISGAASRFKKPQIIARDEAGQPIWRNLAKLQKLLSPHSFRVLKKDCLDLPPKIYQTQYFELDAAHRRLYDTTKKELRITVEEDLLTFSKLAIITKLQQITSGFLKIGDETADLDNTQRLDTLLELVEDIDGSVIIWAKFRRELADIAAALRKANYSVVEYHGGTGTKDRELAIDSFQSGEAKFFVGHQKAGGIGLTLTAANTVIYYSNDYSLEDRLQSEDRAHRIGTTKPVVYIDIVALDTIDEHITAALQEKDAVAKTVMGDTCGKMPT